MKKTFSFALLSLLIVAFIFPLFPTIVYADIGPKPSITLNFDNIEADVYYITLLSDKKSTGPYSFSDRPIDEESHLIGENKEEDIEAWKAFRSYSDSDNFYFIEFFSRCNDENTFRWTYYPPNTFKVLLYFPQDDSFLVSEIHEKYAFDSHYNVSVLKDNASLNLQKSYNYSLEIFSLLIRILLTVAIEVLIALLFELKKKKLLIFIILVNFATQILLNILLNVINYSHGGVAFILNYFWMEMVVFIIEAILFTVYFKKVKTDKQIKGWVAPIYALVSNAVSFILGIIIALKVPGIF